MKYLLPKDEGSLLRQPTEIDIESWRDRLLSMTQVQLASLQRFAKVPHPVFSNSELYGCFQETFKQKGGMSKEVSKIIGW